MSNGVAMLPSPIAPTPASPSDCSRSVPAPSRVHTCRRSNAASLSSIQPLRSSSRDGQFLETVVGGRSEQFAAVVDLAVLVAVKDQESAARRNKIDLFRLAIGIQVKGKALAGQLGGGAGKVQDQRVCLAGCVAEPQAGSPYSSW